MTGKRNVQIEAWLLRAGRAHHRYEQDELAGSFDESWPRWYASWLLRHGLATELGEGVPEAELTGLLADSLVAHRDSGSATSWASFTAGLVVERWSR